jgi:hypothetical protein
MFGEVWNHQSSCFYTAAVRQQKSSLIKMGVLPMGLPHWKSLIATKRKTRGLMTKARNLAKTAGLLGGPAVVGR